MGTPELNFYINKHRKAYEERLKREQQNLQGKTPEGKSATEVEGEKEKITSSEVANEKFNEANSWSRDLQEGYSQHASQGDATKKFTKDENINQVDADYLFALKLNEALNGHAEPLSVANENDMSSVNRKEDAERNEGGEDDVRKPDNSYVECLLGDNNYMPFCANYNVGRNSNTNQNPLSPSGRSRRSGHHVDHVGEGSTYGPYNLRTRNNRMNGFRDRNQFTSHRDRRYSPHFNNPHEPINISLSSDDEEGEVQVNNEVAKSYFSKDDGIRSRSEVFYVPDENLSLTPRQNKPNGQSNLDRPFSARGADSKEEVTIVEGKGHEHFSDEGGTSDVCIQTYEGKGGEEIPRMMESENNFSFQSVEAQGSRGSRARHYNNCGAGLEASKCTVEKSVHGVCDVYNDHFSFTNRGAFPLVRSAATEGGHPPKEGGEYLNGNNKPVKSNCVDSYPCDDYSEEGRYYVHYEPINQSGKDKEKNKSSTFEGVYDVDIYGDRADNESRFLSRKKNHNEGERTKNTKSEYYKAHAQAVNDVIPLEGKDLIGGCSSPYKIWEKRGRRKAKDITQVDRIHSDEGLCPQLSQQGSAPKMTYTLRSSRKKNTNEKIEDPYFCKGESYEAQKGRGQGGTREDCPEDGSLNHKTDLGMRSESHERSSPNIDVCNRGEHLKSGMTYAEMGMCITQGEPSPLNMLHLEKGNRVEPGVNDCSVNRALMEMDDSAQVFAEMTSKCAPAEKSSVCFPFESLHLRGVSSVGEIEQEGTLHSGRNEHPERFRDRNFTMNHCQDGININTFNGTDGGLSEGYTQVLLRNYVEGGKWPDAPGNQSSMLRDVHFSGEVSSSSRMVKSLCGEKIAQNEFLHPNAYDAPKYKMVPAHSGTNLQGKSEEKSKSEGRNGYVNNDKTLNRFNGTSYSKFFTNGKSSFVCTLEEPTREMYIIDEGTTSREPHSTYEQNVDHHHMGGYNQRVMLKDNAQQIDHMKRENVGSVKAEETQMEQVQEEGHAVNSREGDVHANHDASGQSYERGMDDNTTSAIDQCDEESANNEDLSVQQAIINSLIDF
ncbi:conserved Plasmodium protein, unknown function [Plasmodium knowlesi strain H]|uniref:Uncharacterized protein n=3 Tax=Plasmodium knowlesi TaxID=5850 RepID=A0A5K1VJ99_PLAKH|nr:conserved Plasmodium protein, unknown function [Plasmodium knowlesi strain H]OTN67461.1 Uncharacterized protein PKNOH_S06424100 [Plasmodium knowlesi]CAA9987514.1 conserved Plasmodium protein, unknown function [Plasmodium knowlesi strain H]SBO23148.1 conserved Plasmodium protein, unknown function [Plasmodium knowlesi strain H]SBO23804.1 conserved Plasmodium protein, unknown function [Plasmodium knowlesi strain H]VVS76988.1 conserved Plasmodium protein, unknown function [Plasmodium knowlesi s|eukprot:XP_002258515.1 hypothetical protein, conserved in Plasmodium species [Plasmodium knowlesi strain H]